MTNHWFIEPREPIVVREGRSAAALDEEAPRTLPLPSALAGLVRTCFVQDTLKVDPEALLRIRIADGPWFGRWNDLTFEAFVVAPHDAIGRKDANNANVVHLFRKRVIDVDKTSLLFSAEPQLSQLVWHDERDANGAKLKDVGGIDGHRYWSLDRAVKWAISDGDDAPSRWDAVEPLEPETRLHVSIDDTTLTAESGMLYGTPGLRFADGFGFALNVDHVPAHLTNLPLPRVVFLGGEGRVSLRKEFDKDVLPKFNEHRCKYEEAARKKPRGLRLQLLTPAWLSPEGLAGTRGWLPSWWEKGDHPLLPPGIRLHLVAVCAPRPTVISGWDMQWKGRGGPRRVRRLAPAGSIYYFELRDDNGQIITDPTKLVDVAERLWAQPIEMPTSDKRNEQWRKEHLAHPAQDGFGRILPGFFWSSQHEPQQEVAI